MYLFPKKKQFISDRHANAVTVTRDAWHMPGKSRLGMITASNKNKFLHRQVQKKGEMK
jgi:hypothetical protein